MFFFKQENMYVRLCDCDQNPSVRKNKKYMFETLWQSWVYIILLVAKLKDDNVFKGIHEEKLLHKQNRSKNNWKN